MGKPVKLKLGKETFHPDEERIRRATRTLAKILVEMEKSDTQNKPVLPKHVPP